MKKSIIRVLTAALMVCGVGFISSCKDYDEELRVEIQNSGYIDGTLKEEINKEIEDLKEQKEDLAAIIDSLKNLKHCDCNMGDITTSINQAIADALAQYEATHPDTDTDTNFVTEEEWTKIQQMISQAITDALAQYEATHPDTDTNFVTDAEWKQIQQMISDAIKDFKSCTCDPNASSCTCDPNKVSCTCEVKTKKDIEDMISKAITDALASYYTSAQIDEMLKKYALKSDIADMATKAWVTEQINAIKACTTCEEAIKKINERIAEAEKVLEQHGNDIKALYEQYTSLELFIGEVNSLANRAFQAAQNAQKAAEAAQSLAESAMATAQHADQLAQEVADNLETLTNTVNLMGIKLAVLKERVEKINTRLIGVEEQMVEIYQKALDAYTQANTNSTEISTIKNTYTLLSAHNALKDEHDALVGTVTENYTELLTLINQRVSQEQLDEAKAEAEHNLDFVRVYLEGVIGAVAETLEIAVEDIDVLKTDVSTLQTWVNTTGAQLVIDVDGLKTRMTEAEAAIDQNAQDIAQNASDIAALQQEILRIDALEKNLNSLVTSIEIQQTSNPLFGSVNLPLGIQTNVLALWYGKALNDGTFPSYGKTAPYIWESQAMSSAVKGFVGAPKNDYYEYTSGDMLYDDSEGNAGTIYMTVNPSNVDFTGTTFSLVNSLDEESAFKLGALQPSDRLIQHGITRSAANGLYEAPVTLSEDDIYSVNLNVADGLLSSVKDVLSNATNPGDINTSKLASTVKSQVEDMRTDALGLKAYSADQDRSVYSQYALAGVAIKNPITYASFKDFNYQTVPGYDRVNNVIDRVAKSIKSRVHSAVSDINNSTLVKDIKNLTIKRISIEELDDATLNKFKLSFTVKKEFDLAGKTVKFNIDKDVTLPLQFSTTADLSGVSFTAPSIVVTGTGTAPEVIIPIYEDVDRDGKYTDGVDELAKDFNGEPIYAKYPTTNISVSGTTTAGATITAPDGTTATVNVNQTISTHITLNDLEFTIPDDDTFKFVIDETFSPDLTEAIKDLWSSVQGQIGGVNDMLDDVKKIVQDVNDQLDKINNIETTINGGVDDVAELLHKIIDKLNAKAVSFINNINSRLQPILIASGSNGTRLLSQAKNYPSTINSGVDLYATNYLGEVVAPAFKKHIAVTNVYELDGTVASNAKNLASEVNGCTDMNRVLEGKQLKVAASGFKSGYIYELAYSALDYTGKQVTHKYYVSVK